MREQGDTRSRIQQVALELFTEHGYEATSLREIAERLGVTKAALYYHFKTKDDILTSIIESRIGAMDDLIAWGQAQPGGAATRREFVRRYAALMTSSRHHQVMRFLERNQTALRSHPKSERMREIMYTVMDLLSSPGDPLPVRVKCSVALFAMHATWFIDQDGGYTDDERTDAALAVALELVESAAAEAERSVTR